MAKQNIQRPSGTEDLFGEQLQRLEGLERLAANTARLWGYTGIRTPIFEHTGLFVRSIGEVTDIVEKEMFTIPRQTEKEGADSFTLRPENTAGVVRAYLEHNLHKTQGLAKLSYLGPQFRRERPQKGRLRQFHQMGVEVLGLQKEARADQPASPLTAYAEVMLLIAEILRRAGLKGLKLRYNSVGCKADGCRDSYRANLKAELSKDLEKLCGDCRKRIDRNVFRVLDCKKPNCRELCTRSLTTVPQEFCSDCLTQINFVTSTLDALAPKGVQVEKDPFLVRGLDYYTGTVFECTAEGLGAQDAVGGGGSYDGLIEELGGPSLGATGFALGLERVLLAQEAAGAVASEVPVGDLSCVIPIGDLGARPYELAVKLRQDGLNVAYDLGPAGKKVGKLLSRAEGLGAKIAVIIGEEELRAGETNLKVLETREERRVKQDQLAEEIRKVIG